jgi:hypothetical protein
MIPTVRGASMWVTLPHGIWIGGRPWSRWGLRPVGVEDEVFLVETDGMLPAHRANRLLARCIDPLESGGSEPGAVVRSMVIGDREALLLHLRRVTLGDGFSGVFRCARPDCTEPLELDLKVSDLLLPAYPHAAERYACAVEHEGATLDVRFRLPTAGDQEDAAEVARQDPEAAARWVLGRCVVGLARDGLALDVSALTQPVIDRIASAMEELDPQAIIEFDMTCPACGTAFSAQLDAGDFLLRELDQRADHLLREVHTLATAYHWSEDAILAMPQARRERYLELIAAGAGVASS